MRELFLYYCSRCMIIHVRFKKIKHPQDILKPPNPDDRCNVCQAGNCLIPVAINFITEQFIEGPLLELE